MQAGLLGELGRLPRLAPGLGHLAGGIGAPVAEVDAARARDPGQRAADEPRVQGRDPVRVRRAERRVEGARSISRACPGVRLGAVVEELGVQVGGPLGVVGLEETCGPPEIPSGEELGDLAHAASPLR